ncbi:PDDEXK nuclease domain-containing protein [Variovorax guangxiensis]|uniref:PDDEXK nuclease domain-containing protein n=1 Tax=Variovorax guangxiensis TaxID=1775474 RepID=UPI0028546B4A|nr:PDDEXK nuclease domain-containing protein [Variovorax guangxiensis]MDR6861053.1 hypothetical protein [Variovorax guangxiensis]
MAHARRQADSEYSKQPAQLVLQIDALLQDRLAAGEQRPHLGYFANEENVEGDNPPVGIILSRQKDELLVEYATYGMSSQLFAQKYQLYLPDREALRRELELTLREAVQ